MNPNDSNTDVPATAGGNPSNQPAAASAPAQPAAAASAPAQPAVAPRDRSPRDRRDDRRPRDDDRRYDEHDDRRDRRPRDDDRSDRRRRETAAAPAASSSVSWPLAAMVLGILAVLAFLWYVGKTNPSSTYVAPVAPTVVAPAPTYVAPAPVYVENPTVVAPAPVVVTPPRTQESLREEMRLQFGTAEVVHGPSSANPVIQWGIGNNGEIRVPIFLRPDGQWSILTGDLVGGVKTPPNITTPETGRKWAILDNPTVAPKLTAPDGRTIPTDGAVKDGAIVFGTVQ